MKTQTVVSSPKFTVRSLESWETFLSAKPKRSKERTEGKLRSMRLRPPISASDRPVPFPSPAPLSH